MTDTTMVLPLKVVEKPDLYRLEQADGSLIICDYVPEKLAFIARRVNSHDKLVEALRGMLVWAIGCISDKDNPQRTLNAVADLRKAMATLREVGVDPCIRDIGLDEIESAARAALTEAGAR